MNVDKICEEVIWYGEKKNGRFIIPIVIDFDFTITKESSWLNGTFTENDRCFEIMKRWIKDYNVGFILETMRGENHIKPAIKFIEDNGIELYGIGRNPTQDADGDMSCKCWGIFDIDDRNVGIPTICTKEGRPYVDWLKVDEIMTPILDKIAKRIPEVEDRVLEVKHITETEHRFVEIDYSY